MKKERFKSNVLVKLSFLICMFAFVITSANARPTTSSCSLINPPSSSVDWVFEGNQAVWINLQNANVLGVTVTLTCNNYASADSRNFVILPFDTVSDIAYDLFAYVPISWSFTLSTISDAACVNASARWNSFRS